MTTDRSGNRVKGDPRGLGLSCQCRGDEAARAPRRERRGIVMSGIKKSWFWAAVIGTAVAVVGPGTDWVLAKGPGGGGGHGGGGGGGHGGGGGGGGGRGFSSSGGGGRSF